MRGGGGRPVPRGMGPCGLPRSRMRRHERANSDRAIGIHSGKEIYTTTITKWRGDLV